MTLLIIGPTGTLGRQIVRKAINEGYKVKCFVRNLRKAYFLKEWGAELIYGDLSLPETIPLALKDVNVIIDASTARPSDPYSAELIDLEGKIALIEAAKVAQIKKFIFFSVINGVSYSKIPPIKLKLKIESYLKESEINYTIFHLSGFFQGLIGQFAIPILERQNIWVTNENKKINYIDAQDVAKFVLQNLTSKETNNRTFPLIGPKAWNSNEIIELCEKLSGQKASTNKIPLVILQIVKKFVSLFEWGKNISDRLSLTEILATQSDPIPDMNEVCNIHSIQFSELSTLEQYMQDYFGRILRRLKELHDEKNKNL